MASTKARIGPKELGIDLRKQNDSDVFRWLVACQLSGARISQDIAADTFKELDKAGVLTPRKLAGADWLHLVDLLGKGGYRRYDESTTRELIAVGRLAVHKYGGKVSRIRDNASSKKTIGDRLREFKGIGPISADIFLREMAPVWNL